MKPERVQLSRRKGWKMPPNTVKVTRPGPWGNPFVVNPRVTPGGRTGEWLSRHPEVERYAIVDDDSDMLPEQMPFFVRTSAETGGLKKRHADRLIKLLAA